MSKPEIRKKWVKFVGDEDVLQHISDKAGLKTQNKVPPALDVKRWVKGTAGNSDEETQDIFEEQDYVSVLGTGVKGTLKNGSGASGSAVFPFQTSKRSKKMAEMAFELAHRPGKNMKPDIMKKAEKGESSPKSSKTHSAPSKGRVESKKNELVSKTVYGLRKRLTALITCSDSGSDSSTSDSEKDSDGDDKETVDDTLQQKTLAVPQMTPTSASCKTPVKKLKKDISSNLVEEYFEAHSSSKVITSDRTLQKLQKGRLDQETLQNILSKVPIAFAAEREELNKQHESLFYKWMLQLHLGFNIVLYGLGSKKSLLENFRISLLKDSVHIVVNGFFPSITVKSILNSVTEEVLDHAGTFHSPQDQLDFIRNRFKEDPSLELYLLIHNLDSQMLRGDKSQQILGQLASLPNVYLIASIDHINAPLMWDQAKQSLFNWLWYEATTYSPYVEETSYENSLLIKQSGSLALSSLTHVLRSLTPNARGIFRLLVQHQLENKDNPSYPGLPFQDFYQQCREAFLVNSDLTLRAQLTEFRDHKLIRTKRGADGVEYLLIPVDTGTLIDFLEKDNEV